MPCHRRPIPARSRASKRAITIAPIVSSPARTFPTSASNTAILKARISATRVTIQKYPMIGALKAIVAYYGDDPDWVTVRPPLMELGTDKTRSLVAELNRLGFKMPGLAEATARV